MNDLPIQGAIPTSTPTPAQPQGSDAIGGISNKEKEAGGLPAETPFRPSGVESELSPEVSSSGVKIRPTTIPIPQSVAQMGVKPAGQNVPAASAAVTLPLSDDQIAVGLQQSVWSSWRWLAEWCVRKLKQLHMGIRSIHGKFTRVRT